MTVRQLLRNTDSAELAEWRAFFRIRDEQVKRQQAQANARSNAEQMTHKLRRGR